MTSSIPITGNVKGGVFEKIHELCAAFPAFEGQEIDVCISKRVSGRSNCQNRYYWGVVVKHVMQMFQDAGDVVDAEETHHYLKRYVGKLVDLVHTPSGDRVILLRSSRKLSTAQFEEYLEAIRCWAAELGYIIPLPNEEKYNEWVNQLIEEDSKNHAIT